MKTIMFHRFKDKNDTSTGQGSFSPKQLENYINKKGVESFVNSDDIYKLREMSIIPKNKILFTFDDGLFSQYESAKPILDKFNLKSFWFIYTKILENKFDENEVLNYFIGQYFSSFNCFYPFFENLVPKSKINWESSSFREYFKESNSKFPFYSKNDIKFRFLRNKIISKKEFRNIVIKLLSIKNLSLLDIAEKIWIDRKKIKEISDSGHEIGLHSHNHPYEMKNLNYKTQFFEYCKNKDLISSIITKEPISVAYPLGSYNHETLKVMKKLKIKLGFRSSSCKMAEIKTLGEDLLLLPRIDSSNLQ